MAVVRAGAAFPTGRPCRQEDDPGDKDAATEPERVEDEPHQYKAPSLDFRMDAMTCDECVVLTRHEKSGVCDVGETATGSEDTHQVDGSKKHRHDEEQ